MTDLWRRMHRPWSSARVEDPRALRMVRLPSAANFKDIEDLLLCISAHNHFEQKELFRRPQFRAVTFATLRRILFPPTYAA